MNWGLSGITTWDLEFWGALSISVLYVSLFWEFEKLCVQEAPTNKTNIFTNKAHGTTKFSSQRDLDLNNLSLQILLLSNNQEQCNKKQTNRI